LFIKQWTLAWRFAEQRAAAEAEQAAEAADEDSGAAAVREPLSDTAREALRQEQHSTLATIDTQLRHLMRLGVAAALLLGMWFIWSDTLPALRALDRIPVWPAAQRVTDVPTVDAAATTGVQRAAVPAAASEPAPTEPPVEAVFEPEVPIEGTSVADVLLTLLIAVLTFLAGRNVPGLLEVLLLERLPLNSGARNAVTTLSGYAIMLSGVLIGSQVVGLRWENVQWLVAALGVGLGFGLQEIFANFVSGLILLFERPIRVGDVITLDDVTGSVTRIQIRATTITDWDRKELIVPNKDLITGRLLNWTLADRINRLVIQVGVAYGSDTQRVHDLLLQIAQQHPDVLEDPAPLVTFEAFGDSTLDFVLRCYLSGLNDRLPVLHALNCTIHQRFAAAGIEIAFPQRDLHIRSYVNLPPGDAAPAA
jgi:potassium efflux system protein